MASPGKKPFLLRIDPLLWAEVERLAAQELRSANAQVEYLLRDALRQRGRLGGAAGVTSAAGGGATPQDAETEAPPDAAAEQAPDPSPARSDGT